MQTKCKVLFALLFINIFANAQDDSIVSVASTDSVLTQIEDYTYHEWHAFSLSRIDKISMRSKPITYYDSIRTELNWIIQQVDKPLAQAICHARLADLYENIYQKGNYADTTILYRQIALAEYEKANAGSILPYAHLNLAVSLKNFGKYNLGEQHIFKTIALFEELENQYGIFLGYRNLCDFCRHRKNYPQAIQYGEKAIQVAHKTSKETLHLGPLLCLVTAYRLNGDYEKSLEAAERYINHFELEEQKVNSNISYMLSEQAETYVLLGCEQEAIANYEYAMQLNGIQAKDFLDDGYEEYLFLKKEYRKVLPILKEDLKAFLDAGNKEFTVPVFQKIITCYEQLGEPGNALDYCKRLLEHAGNIHEEELKATQNELLVKYETDKKEATISLQTQKIDQQKTTQWIFTAFLSLLGIFSAVLYRNYSNKKRLNLQLQLTNEQNELLLKEIHHRVKNNLQTISSLLNLQSNSIEDLNALNAVQESRNRVASMALIHQKLYQGENLAAIEMRDYFETIGRSIISSFDGMNETVELKIEMLEIELDVDTAIPIGLITNELLTNSLKYAFKENGNGKISITMQNDENNLIQLMIADNGKNNSSDFNEKGTGFGSMLVNLLTTQLGGQLEQSTTNGTTTIIKFPLK